MAPLTDRQRNCAELAAAGLTDALIAELLGISARTVAWHLSYAYTRLGIGGRGGLAAALNPPDEDTARWRPTLYMEDGPHEDVQFVRWRPGVDPDDDTEYEGLTRRGAQALLRTIVICGCGCGRQVRRELEP